VEIRLPRTSEECAAALRLAEHEYQVRSYVKGLEPLVGDAVVLIATENEEIMGTVSVALGTSILPTEEYFGLHATEIFPVEPAQIMEIGRLAVSSTAEGMTKIVILSGLIAAIQMWGDEHGVKIAIASLKPSLRRALTLMDIASTVIADADDLIRERVPSVYAGYFLPDSPRHRPIAVSMVLDEVREPILTNPAIIGSRVQISVKAPSAPLTGVSAA